MANMFSIAIPICDALSRCLDFTARPVKYVRDLEENLNVLFIETEELRSMRDDVQRKIEIVERLQMERLDHVGMWLSQVNRMENEVQEIAAVGSQEIGGKWLGGCLPKNCKRSYKLGKKVARKIEAVADLKRKGTFDMVGSNPPLSAVEQRPGQSIVGLESAVDEVWSYIRDERVGIIGLYGMGGVGKTTLLAQINNMLSTIDDFDVVIWVAVSRSPNPIMIIDAIGRRLGLNGIWENKSQGEKATDIFGVLVKKKFVLFLDDMWERLDLSEMGVPLPNQENKSKVLFTTRSEDVCGQMEVHKKIKVNVLLPEKAWCLFQKKVGEDTFNDNPEITELAKTVAKECNGLPLALITVGRAMSHKTTLEEWRHAISVFKKSAAMFSGMREVVFPTLKLSYDSLQSDTVRSSFLYCSLFPEDCPISKETLIEYWIGEGFLEEFDDLSGAQDYGHFVINTLIRACLLVENSSDKVVMNRVIRDMALWIACECGMVKNKVLVLAGADLEIAPDVRKWKGAERMSLMHNHIDELPGTPSCLNLLTLFLNNNNLKMIPGGFFQHMSNLKVLDLSQNYYLDELPAGISELFSLQYLNLSFTNIKELPYEFKSLVKLKYLGLDYTSRLIIQQGVLSSFKKLLVLKMFRCGEENSVYSGGLETLVEELEGLKYLNHLGITIKDASALQQFLRSPKLPTYTRSLSLLLFRGSNYLEMSFLEKMTCLDNLVIEDCVNLEESIIERVGEGMASSEISSHPCFHRLRIVYIRKCPLLKDLSWLIFAPNLEELIVRDCHKMEDLICGGKLGETAEGGYLKPFAKLQNLDLSYLPQLKSIYPNALPFPCLKSIKVFECPHLKKLPLNANSAKSCGAAIKGSEDWWTELEWEDTESAFLHSFNSFGV